jgi:hypothetical protein
MTNRHGARPTLDRALRFEGSARRPAGIALPPARMPLVRDWKLLKRWRYVGVWTREIAVYAGSAWIGPVSQQFWAVWDRARGKFYERTRFLPGKVKLTRGRMLVKDGPIEFDIALDENEGFETITPSGRAYTWTRKQLIPARGAARIHGAERSVEGFAFIDDNAGYHARRMRWKWSGGVGADTAGRAIGWNLIVGLNDTPGASENTVWIDGAAQEVGPVSFAEDLSSLTLSEGGVLRFQQEATRERKDNLLLLRSDYAQPLGTFTGSLLNGVELKEAYGVMERQDALW